MGRVLLYVVCRSQDPSTSPFFGFLSKIVDICEGWGAHEEVTLVARAWNIRLSSPCQRMCPNHFCLRIRIFFTTLKLHVASLASCGIVLSIILTSITLLTALILRHIFTEIGQHRADRRLI